MNDVQQRLTKAEKYVKDNLQPLCAELVDLGRGASITEDSCLHDLMLMVKPLASSISLNLARAMIHWEAVQHVANGGGYERRAS